MELSVEKRNRIRKKVIPWHVQQRYMESFSLLSLNQSISTAFYKKKIKSLLRNNKHLALTLQQHRYLATDKENLLADNRKIFDVINFSRLKLMDMATNMKQATECLDETLLLLNSSIADSLSKNTANNVNYKNDLKNKLQELSRNSPIKEVSETSDSSSKDIKSCAQKGKISRVDGYSSSPNKKCKLAKQKRNVKRNHQGAPKSAKGSSTKVPSIDAKESTENNSKKCSSALNIKPQSTKKSLPKNCNRKSTSSSKLPTTNSNIFLQNKNTQSTLDKKRKAVKVILTDIAEAFITRETEHYRSPEKNEPTFSTNSTNFKYSMQNSPEDDFLITKYFSSQINRTQSPNSCGSQFVAVNDTEIQNCSHSSISSNCLHKDLSSSGEMAENNKLPVPFSEKNEIVYDPSSIVKMQPKEENHKNATQSDGKCNKNTKSERKNKESYKLQNTKVINRVHFYFDEDAIEKVDGEAVASKDKLRKSVNKCKARKTVSNGKKNIPLKSKSLNSNFILPDNVSKLGKNSFLVTAEVHSPHNGIYAQKMKNQMCITGKMEPSVVLTDIFKSNQGLLSEMVSNGLQENGHLQKAITNSTEAPLTTFTVNDLNTNFMDFENITAKEDHLLEDGSIRMKVFCQEKSEEIKNTCKKQPAVALREIKNCKKVFNKSGKSYSNAMKNVKSYVLMEKENRRLPEDKEIIENKEQRRRAKIVSYKEPSLNVKLRRLL